MIRLGIVGSGWRTSFIKRIVDALPDTFAIDGMVVRNAAKAKALAEDWQVRTFPAIASMLSATSPDFVFTAVPSKANPSVLKELAGASMPVLSETPPGSDLDGLHEVWSLAAAGAKVQVAEQYNFQPHHAARLAIVRSGLLGTVHQARISVCHDYHAMSLLRHLLDIHFEPVTVNAFEFDQPLVAGPNRAGPPTQETIQSATTRHIRLDFGAKLGLSDFCGTQYGSYIRGQTIRVQGERGEITDDRVTWLQSLNEPCTVELVRHRTGTDGNLQGHCLKGIQGGDRWWWTNPFSSARLPEEEIAIADVLQRMAAYVGGGEEVYPLAEGIQDHYLTLLAERSIATQAAVPSKKMPWMQ